MSAANEYDEQFWEMMKDRMRVSYHKYGPVKDAYPAKVSALESLQARLNKYLDTGNKEWLVDAANFAMIEFMCPSHPQAHFRSTDSNESPGRAAYDNNFDLTGKSNAELTDNEWKELQKFRGA